MEGDQVSKQAIEIRPLYEIAADVRRDWRPVNYAAAPYLKAMECLTSVSDSYLYDDARSIVLYFLSNARSWKGETAKRIKAELRAMTK